MNREKHYKSVGKAMDSWSISPGQDQSGRRLISRSRICSRSVSRSAGLSEIGRSVVDSVRVIQSVGDNIHINTGKVKPPILRFLFQFWFMENLDNKKAKTKWSLHTQRSFPSTILCHLTEVEQPKDKIISREMLRRNKHTLNIPRVSTSLYHRKDLRK